MGSTISFSTVEKMHNMAESFRRERDDALRLKMTATERLRLVSSEADALQATIENFQKQLKELKDQENHSKALVNKYEKDVAQLLKEVSKANDGMQFYFQTEK